MNSKFLSRIARHLLIPNRRFVLFVVLMSVFAMRASSGAPMATAPQSSATDELTGKLQVWQKDSTMIFVFDAQGKLLAQQTVESTQSLHAEVPVEAHHGQILLVKVVSGESSKAFKLGI